MLEAIAVIPYEAFDLVGVEGHAAVATTPVPRATAPFDREVLRPEDLQTEEFAAWG